MEFLIQYKDYNQEEERKEKKKSQQSITNQT